MPKSYLTYIQYKKYFVTKPKCKENIRLVIKNLTVAGSNNSFRVVINKCVYLYNFLN
jgi:hypothetical protein